jgi:sigma-B regulation protein RsbU (phosphoserine phosphatase)
MSLADNLLVASGDPALDLSRCRVLVIDDALPIRQLIGGYLQSAGISLIEFAENGADGLAKLHSFGPDLVILDIVMPGIDGFEICRRLRANPLTRNLPVLVETALDSTADRSAVFDAGATDLITKPIHGPELIARVKIQLENRLLIRSLQDHVKLMMWELELARYMQENLLPRQEMLDAVERATGLAVASHFQPSAELGGDLWSVHPLGDGQTGISIIDFAGHGLAAALNTFRLHTLMNQIAPTPADPAAYLAQLNRKLVDLLPNGQFATMFLAIIDSRRGLMTYAAAGTPSPVIGNPEIGLLDGSGLPLGISLEADYQNCQVPFPPDSVLFLYSDALTESADHSGHCLESEDLAELVDQCRGDAGKSLPLDRLIARFLRGRGPVTDDLTLVWVRQGRVPA